MPDTFPIICSVTSYPDFTYATVICAPHDHVVGLYNYEKNEWGVEGLPSGLFLADFAFSDGEFNRKTDWRQLTDVQAVLLARGTPLDQIVRAPNVQLTPTCGVCLHKYEPTATGFDDAVKCAAQGEPPKPVWLDRVVEKGVYVFGEAGVRGASGRSGVKSLGFEPARVLYAEVQQDASGKHTWWLCLSEYVHISHKFLDDERRTTVPLDAVDPMRGWDFGCYLGADARAKHAKLWWKVATEHYGLDVKFIPEDDEHTGPMWDAIRVEAAARLAEKVLGQREEDKP